MTAGFEVNKPLNQSGWGRCLVWGWVLVLLLVPVHGTLSVWLGSNFGNYLLWRSWKEALVLVLLAAALIWLTREDPKLLRLLAGRRINQLIAIYALLHLALIPFGPNLEAVAFALVYNLRFLGLFLLAQVIGHYWQRNGHNLVQLNKLVLIPAAVVIGFGLLQMFVLPPDWLKHLGYGSDTIEPFTTIDAKSEWVRISSFTRGANQLAQYLILPLVLAGAFWLKRRSWRLSLVLLAGLAVMVGTYSRSGWLGLAVATVSYVLMSIDWAKHGRRVLIGTGVGLAALAGLVWIAPNSEDLRIIIFHDDQAAGDALSADEVRSIHNERSLRLIAEQPLGHGPGAAGPASFHNDNGSRINDNYYLQLGLEVGVIGLLLFLAICWLVAKNLWQQRSELWPRVLLAAFVGISLINLFLPAWANEETALIWWGLAGLWYKPSV